ncbi:hypothetical protein [Microbacterium sp. A94]|uniref:hypothetical protein n=1 Tax=Microbacterium sp. A94 TaxID=3450717 RepID=UPI003F431944
MTAVYDHLADVHLVATDAERDRWAYAPESNEPHSVRTGWKPEYAREPYERPADALDGAWQAYQDAARLHAETAADALCKAGDCECSLPEWQALEAAMNGERIAATVKANPIFADVGAILDGTLERPRATVGRMTSGNHLFYRASHNQLIGDPESAKSLLALSVAADELFNGGSVFWVDMDHNGAGYIVNLFREWGVQPEVLRDPSRFLLLDPEDKEMLKEGMDVAISAGFTFSVIDSIGELLGLYGVSANDDEGYTPVNRAVMARMARAGLCVISIDHMAKGHDSREYGASGTIAKKRAIDGAMYEVAIVEPFAPGKGGRSRLKLRKDRKGNIREHANDKGKAPHIADFVLTPLPEGGNAWKFYAKEAPVTQETKQEQDVNRVLADLDAITVTGVKALLGCATDYAALIARLAKAQATDGEAK